MLPLLLTILLAMALQTSAMNGQKPICSNVIPGGCIRYVSGFDVTGVTTEVDLAYPQVKSACDCIQACKNRKNTCANFVWKFLDASGKRACTLYSNFNLPPGVTIGFDTKTSVDINEHGHPDLTTQPGGTVPHCTLNGTHGTDPHCVSGALWLLDDDKLLC